MAEPKYYADDKAILDMMYQMVYGGQPTTSIERSYGGMKNIPKPPTPPDDSIMDEYMELNKNRDIAQAFASQAAIKTPIDFYSMGTGKLAGLATPIAYGKAQYEMQKDMDKDIDLKLTPEKSLQTSEGHAIRSSFLPPFSAPSEALLQASESVIISNKMKELYEQMTPEQKAKVNAKLREQSVEKIDSAIDSYPGDF
jgi:hypothetical protein